MNYLRVITSHCLALIALLGVATLAGAQDYFFVGSPGGDFFDQASWNSQPDGLGAVLPGPVVDAGTSNVEFSLVIDGDSVTAGSVVEIGSMGSLTINSGGMFDISEELFVYDSGSLTMVDAFLTVIDGENGQVNWNENSIVSLTRSSVTASDDFFIRSQTTIIDSYLESTGDDIEFRTEAVINQISGSEFFASSMGTSDFDQFIILQTPSIVATNSYFHGGLLGIDGTGTQVLAIDSTFLFAGDVENAFGSSSNGNILTLAGTSTLEADQLEEGILMVLDDSSVATLIDGAEDSDDPGWITTNALVRIDSVDAALVLTDAQDVSNANRVFNGTSFTTYSATPGFFIPSTWDGMSPETIMIVEVPEPAASGLVLVLLGAYATRGLRQRPV